MTKKLGIFLGGAILLGAFTARGATTANVTISNDSFTDGTSGNTVTTIHEGDSVHWHWSNSDHSTTSGRCQYTGGAYGSYECVADGTWDSGVNSSGFDFTRKFDAAGSFSYYCQVHGTMGMTGTVIVQSAAPSCGTISLAPSNLTGGVKNSQYESLLTASGGTSPYTFTLTSGNLPAGVQLDDSGEVHGTPTATGTFQFTVKATDSSASHCSGTQAYSVTISSGSPAGDTVAIAGLGSLAGANGAHFKTQVQLTNPGLTTIAGKIVYHVGGTPGSADDPSLPYTLASWQTINIDDVLAAMGLSGLGTADIVPTSGPAPVANVKIFNDDGANGTAGFTEPTFRSQDALQPGDEAVLILPADPVNFRFNLGVRTLGDGISATFTIWNEAGNLVGTVQKSYDPNSFAQAPATAFLGVGSLPTNGSIGITVTQGSGFFFGSTVDNRGSQDTSTQFTRHQ